MKKFELLSIVCLLLLVVSCREKKTEEPVAPVTDVTLPGDRAIYGLACDGCTDSVFVLLPTDCSDPISFDIINASKRGTVLGKARIGDWVAVLPNENDSTVADLVVNLDELKGTWCYIVMPRLRGNEQMTDRTEAKLMDELPDSVKESYLIPREYGFSLKRQWQAQSVGYVRQTSAVEEESPVVYPPLAYFSEWHVWNGKLIMTSGVPEMDENSSAITLKDERNDTCDILYLRDDSLVLGSDGMTRGYYRLENVADVNKKANEMAKKLQQKALDELKK